MRKFLRAVAYALTALVVLALSVLLVAHLKLERNRARQYELAKMDLPLTGDAEEVEHGRHLATTRGCSDCHGADFSGALVVDAGPVGYFVGSNLTRGGRGQLYDAASFEHAVRHGVRVDGRSLLFMPSTDYAGLSDADVAALWAYLRSVPAQDKAPAPSTVGFLGKVLYLFGQFPLLPAELINHTRSAPVATPPASVSIEYGSYVAQACIGCHGHGFSGGHVPGTPPEFKDAANLTPDPSGLKDWTEADFLRAMREGKRPDGRELDAFMPWRTFALMNDTELRATWMYLQTLPAKARGTR
jgi:cytochrome c553